jgi:hypothetical protein
MVNRHQQDVIEYLKEENKVLREKIGGKRILLRVTSYRNRGGCTCQAAIGPPCFDQIRRGTTFRRRDV